MGDPNILCLFTHSRSGSNLFQSLLDGHPQIISFPWHMQFGRFWKSVEHRKNNPSYLTEEFIKRHPEFFSGRYWKKNDRGVELGPGRDETFSVDTERFKKNVLMELGGTDITRAKLFLALHKAYHVTRGAALPARFFILYHIHYIDCVEEVVACMEDFPGSAHAIVMTRHPIDELNACVKVMQWRDTIFCGELFTRHKQILRGIVHIRNACPDLEIRYISYEYILAEHKDAMTLFTKWLRIDWSDTLMHSTVHGRLWWGNGKMPYEKVANRKLFEPSTFLEKKDWAIYRGLVFKRMKKLGYITRPTNERRQTMLSCLLMVLLPTKAEWETFKCMVSIRYWSEIAKNNKESRPLLVCIIRLNPLAWAYYFLKRIVYYYQFALTGYGETVDEPVLTEGLPEAIDS